MAQLLFGQEQSPHPTLATCPKTGVHFKASVGNARAGQGLLSGLLRCGRCGRKLYVRYWGKAGTAARYLCSGTFGSGGSYCLGFGGRTADSRFSEEVLRAISALGIRASLEAVACAGNEEDARRKAVELKVEQLEYEARRAFEQYNEEIG